jgi:hypothetical protein
MEMIPQIIYMKQLEDVQDFTCNWTVDFAMDDEGKRSRMKESTSELSSLISSLKLGSEEMCIEDYVQLVGEEIVDAKYNMVELVDLARGREVDLGLDLNEEPMEGNHVDDPPT